MSRLEEAIKNIVDVFLESAGNDTSKFKMGQDELKDMLDKEIQSPEIKVSNIGHSCNKENL